MEVGCRTDLERIAQENPDERCEELEVTSEPDLNKIPELVRVGRLRAVREDGIGKVVADVAVVIGVNVAVERLEIPRYELEIAVALRSVRRARDKVPGARMSGGVVRSHARGIVEPTHPKKTRPKSTARTTRRARTGRMMAISTRAWPRLASER
jgi:hypothetical protein